MNGQSRKHFMQDVTGWSVPVFKAITTDADRSTLIGGSVLLLDGRRYKVKTRGGATAAGATGKAYVQLTENYAGGRIQKLCSNCVAVTAAGSIKSFNVASSTVEDAGQLMSVTKNDYLAIKNHIHADLLATVTATTAAGGSDTIATTSLGLVGTAANAPSLVNINLAGGQTIANTGIALYKVGYGAGGAATPTVVTEVATGSNTFQYVAQCSNRGTCDSATGVCKCFKGYANDNCDKQNMLAM